MRSRAITEQAMEMNTIMVKMVYEGTKYGETDQFPLVGYTVAINELMTFQYHIKDKYID